MYSKGFKISTLLIIITAFASCWINEPFEELTFTAEVVNNSNQEVIITLLTPELADPIRGTVKIAPNTQEFICSYRSTNFAGFFGCEVTRLEFRFADSTGYHCDVGRRSGLDGNFGNVSDSCFTGKDPFLPSQFTENDDGTIFTITQEDYENAFEL